LRAKRVNPAPAGSQLKRAVLWLLAVVATVGATLLIFFPAPWLTAIVERESGGRLTLGDAQGTLWHGSAFIGGAPGPGGAVTPLLPGRVGWRLSPLALLGQVDLVLENAAALSQPLHVRGTWSHWQVSPAALLLPAQGLAGLGAPLNTIAPSGTLRLSWSTLELARQERRLGLTGRTTLEMKDMASRLSSIRPLGSYELALDWRGQSAQLTLSTRSGALLLSGKGALEQGRFRFSGQAKAAAGYEETLGNLLNLLGQRRIGGDKNTIALEFKQ
jgi:general secretion pathway protein N